eukprot:347166-Chlamydomonas_euryale.AAC.3
MALVSGFCQWLRRRHTVHTFNAAAPCGQAPTLAIVHCVHAACMSPLCRFSYEGMLGVLEKYAEDFEAAGFNVKCEVRRSAPARPPARPPTCGGAASPHTQVTLEGGDPARI